jgi:hypothetical protein
VELPRPEPRGPFLLADDRLDRGSRAVGQLDLDHEGAEFAQRLVEFDFAFVDSQVASLAQRVGDLLRPDRSEQLAVLAGPLVDRQHGLGEQPGRRGFALCARRFRPFLGLQAPLRLLQSARGRRLRQFARDEVVAQVARGDVDRLAALAERLDVLEQDRLCHQRSPT